MIKLLQCRICLGNLRGPIVGSFFICDKCCIHYNTIIPTKQALKQSLSGFMLTACSSQPKMQRRLDKAHKQFDIIAPYISAGKLYDIGAAGGFVMKAAINRGWHSVYGNELSKTAVAWAKRMYDISIFDGFVEDDPIAAMSMFDLIILWNTLEHMIDPIATLAFVTAMLRPGGYIYIRVPIKTEVDIVKFYEVGHMVEFTKQSLEILRKENRLEEVIKTYPESRVPCVDLFWRKP